MLIGVPVGFVNVEEAKEQVLALCRGLKCRQFWPWDGKVAAMWQRLFAMPCSIWPGICWTLPNVAGSEKEKNRKRKPSEFLLFKEFWGLFGMILEHFIQ